MNDPLKGMRRKIANGDMRVLRWPADRDCPVEKGQRFKVMGIVIQIHSIERRIQAGKPVQWHATYIRHEPDRVYLVRQSQPARATHEKPEDVTLDMAERARRDGNYTSSRVAAMPMEPESVGPDWKDKRRLERERQRQEAMKQIRRKKYERDTSRRVKIAVEQKFKELNAKDCDYMPLVAEIYEILDRWTVTRRNAA